MRVGISGTHGTGKTTLAGALCARLPGHVVADEPYYLLEEEGYEFGFPPSLEDYRALLARSVQTLSSSRRPGIVFDRTPLDYLAYLAAIGADPADEAGAAALQPAFASLDLLAITVITPETEQVLPAAEMPRLRSDMNDALVELVHDDPLNAWEDIPVLELDGPLDRRLDAVLAALDQARRLRPRRTPLPGGYFEAVQEAVEDRAHRVAGGGAVVGAGDVEAGLGDHRDQQAGEGLDRHRRDAALLGGAGQPFGEQVRAVPGDQFIPRLVAEHRGSFHQHDALKVVGDDA
jgi:AAA domain